MRACRSACRPVCWPPRPEGPGVRRCRQAHGKRIAAIFSACRVLAAVVRRHSLCWWHDQIQCFAHCRETSDILSGVGTPQQNSSPPPCRPPRCPMMSDPINGNEIADFIVLVRIGIDHDSAPRAGMPGRPVSGIPQIGCRQSIAARVRPGKTDNKGCLPARLSGRILVLPGRHLGPR